MNFGLVMTERMRWKEVELGVLPALTAFELRKGNGAWNAFLFHIEKDKINMHKIPT